MPLWTDLISPAELTGYVRAGQEEYETKKGTLARYLPNRQVPDITVRFRAGRSGLVEEARYRAYDAEPEMVKQGGGERVILELPALSAKEPVSEYVQLRTRNAADEQILTSIQNTALALARGAADRTERMRGAVLATGVAAIDQDNYVDTANFQRDPALTTSVDVPWSDPAASRLEDLQLMMDVYESLNGETPGSLVMSRRVYRALASGNELQVQLLNGGARIASESDVRSMVSAAGLPEITIYDRRTSGGRVIPDNVVLFLPEPGETTNEQGTPLGATFWGQTLTSMNPDYGLAPVDQPGIVTGVYRNEQPPMIAEVVQDAIALPVLANANLSAALTVL